MTVCANEAVAVSGVPARFETRFARIPTCRGTLYLIHENPPSPKDPTVAPCKGTCGDPKGEGISYKRGIHIVLAIDPLSKATHLVRARWVQGFLADKKTPARTPIRP